MMRKSNLLFAVLLLTGLVSAQSPGHITGSIQTATSGTINNGTLTFTLSQPSVVGGTATLVTQPVACYTSNSGSVVGVPDPIILPILSTNTGSGTLAAGTYFVKIYYTGPSSTVSAVSPEGVVVLTSTGTVIVSPPALQPANATGYGVAISATTGTETIQGTVSGFSSQFQQSSALIAGSTPASTNNSVCNLYLSDELIPTGTYYSVNLLNKNGSPIAGYPQSWCTYGGSGATINVSQGSPTGNCNVSGVFYPTPILSTNANLTSQSISTPLTLSGSNFLSGPTTNCNFNNWLFNTSTCFSGSDIGAQFNSAYGAMPGNGTRFHVPASATAYSFTTPMVATTVANSLMFSCPTEQSAILTFTPTTGTALTLAGGGGSHNEGGVQVENCTFYGSGNGNTTTGLQLGSGTNGLSGATFKSIVIGKSTTTAFGTGMNFNTTLNNAYLAHFYNSKIIGNNVGAQLCGEGINFYGGLFGSNVTGMAMGGATNCPSQLHNFGTSFDDNSTVAISMSTSGGNTATWNCTACHFENAGLGTDSYLSMSGTVPFATLLAGELNDDVTSGTSSGFVTASTGQLAVFGTTMGSGGRTNTQAYNLSGTANAILFPMQNTGCCGSGTIQNVVPPAYMTPAGGGGAVAVMPIYNTSNQLNLYLKGTGVEGSTFGPGIDLIGAEASGKWYRIDEVAGDFRINVVTGTFPAGTTSELVGLPGVGNPPWYAKNGFTSNASGFPGFAGAAPTISPSTGFNTGTVTNANGTLSIVITVGSTGTVSTGTLALPTAAHGWYCHFDNQSRAAAGGVGVIVQSANTTASSTLTNFGATLTTPTNWTNGDVLVGSCSAN